MISRSAMIVLLYSPRRGKDLGVSVGRYKNYSGLTQGRGGKFEMS
jgi:hypothetical protein